MTQKELNEQRMSNAYLSLNKYSTEYMNGFESTSEGLKALASLAYLIRNRYIKLEELPRYGFAF